MSNNSTFNNSNITDYDKTLSFQTRAIHTGSKYDEVTGSVVPPIYQTSTYTQNIPGETISGFDYTRCANPSRSSLATCLASLEGAEHALISSSGLASISVATNLVKTGSNIVYVNDVYGGAHRLFNHVLNNVHNFKDVDATNIDNLKDVYKSFDNKVDLLWLETPSNPLLKVIDIAKCVEIAKQHGSIVVVDNTFATPYLQNPLSLGADVVIHSITKYINGHTDVIGGAFITNSQELYDKAFFIQKTLGCQLSPFDSWLVSRGVKTLPIRMEKHQDNALAVAEFLKKHKKCTKVLYPGLKDSPYYELAKKQSTKHFRGGGIVSFYLDGDLNDVKKFISNIKIFKLAESLGGVSSLLCVPTLMTHASVGTAEKEKAGVTENLLRLSVGIEDEEDIINSLSAALDSI